MPPRRACDVCYKRKIQCSIPSPGSACDWCRHQELQCTFLRQPNRKKTEQLTPNAAHDLLRRVEHLETELARKNEQSQERSLSHTPCVPMVTAAHTGTAEASQHWPSPGDESARTLVLNSVEPPDVLSQAHSPFSRPALGEFRSLALQLGQIWYFKGMQILSPMGWEWISSKTGQETRLEKLFSNPGPLPSTLDLHDELPEIPDEPTTRAILDYFSRSSSSLFFSIFDRGTFKDAMRKAYMTPDCSERSQPQLSSKTCVWAFHAFASLFKSVRSLSMSIEGEACAEKVQSLLGYLVGEPSLESLQAILMLQAYRLATGQFQCSGLLLSLACRMVCDLGGHTQQLVARDPPGPSADRQRHRLRMAFWSCYALDKDISLRSGQPPMLVSDYCDLDLRGVCTSPCQGLSAEALKSEDLSCYFPPNPTLCMIKERVFRLLYSPQAPGVSDSQLVLNMRHLDNELEQWRLSLPAELRPRLSVLADRPLMTPGTGSSHGKGRLDLQVEHLYVLIAIHAAVRRAGANIGESESLPDDLHSVIHSSVDITLEAGRSMLLFLKASMDILQEDAFHYLVFYAPTAAMALFVNILVHPLHASSNEDLNALVAALSNIQNMPLRGLTEGETERLQELHNFIMELVRLGNCAVWKAKKDRRV